MVKVVEKINKDEIINHTGDLTVKGDIDKNAQINIEDGSLILSGNIKEGARIKIRLSEVLMISFSPIASVGSVSIGITSSNSQHI
jgi:hypothetical protein